jgi:hypothetical protein
MKNPSKPENSVSGPEARILIGGTKGTVPEKKAGDISLQ